MADEITIDDPDRVLDFGRAIAHPLRVAILLAHANGGPASATMLARNGVGPLANVSYHQVRLLGLGVLDLVDTRQKKGAHERHYDLSGFGTEVLKTAVMFGRKRK